MSDSNTEKSHFDVIIVGAGLSGIGAAYHLQDKCPNRSYTILESRSEMGGTWSLFKYPGIRSDSDMYTLGFSFYPWKDPKAIADGPAILSYIKETAAHFGIDRHIRYNHQLTRANWDPALKKWEVTVAVPEGEKVLTCNFLFMCSGYYDYREGYLPEFKGYDNFKGPVIHPQHWKPEIDYSGKKIVVIGSGATAVTLVPELAKTAREVVMLQRSPTYILNLPSRDKIADNLRSWMPGLWAHTLVRWKNILFSLGLYKVSRRWPDKIKGFIKKQIQKQLGEDYDMSHFDPKYDPWDQRLCLVPDNDLFKSLKTEKARVVTDTIKEFTPEGIALNSGTHLDCDMIITATGLKVKLLGGAEISLDGRPVNTADLHVYRGVMFSGIPNFALAVGYTNASWTLKCDLNCLYVTRILNHMQTTGQQVVTPVFDPERFDTEPLLDFDAGYVKRALDILPKQGSKYPWKIYQNYLRDMWTLKFSKLKDRYLEFS